MSARRLRLGAKIAGVYSILQLVAAGEQPSKESGSREMVKLNHSRPKRMRAQELMSAGLNDVDYVVRRKAADLLEAAGAGSFRAKIGAAALPVRPRGYYGRLEAAMRGANPVATISTEKGDVRVELLIRDAPMTVDNFVELARKDGERWAQQFGGDLSGLEKTAGVWAAGGSLAIESIGTAPDHLDFNVTRCQYAEFYKDLGLPELGYLFHCSRDFAMVEGFDPSLTLKRRQTIMEGAGHCDFRFARKGKTG